MTTTSIINAAPMAILLGIQDLSTTAELLRVTEIPSHLPKVYIYARKGPTIPQLVVGNSLVQLYGAETFDMRQPYATHQTVLAVEVNKQRNAQMIERLLPTDTGPKANFLLSLDILETEVVQYERGIDGRYITNAITGLPVPVSPAATVPGYKVKWVTTSIRTGGPSESDGTTFAATTTTPGDQIDGATVSTRYPILQFWASSYGSYGNNAGFRISAPHVQSDSAVNSDVLDALKAYPFRLSAITRVNENSTPTVAPTLAGEPFIDFVVKPETVNPFTNQPIFLADVLPTAFQQIGRPGYTDTFADLGNFYMYQDNIDLVLGLLYAKEKSFTGPGSDLTPGADDEQYKINFFSGMSSTLAPYHAITMKTSDVNSIAINENTNLFASGGFDGTMDETLFADLVTTAVTQYADPLSPLLDTAVNVESIIYDTGFPLATKRALCSFISQRKDTFVVLSTYDTTGPEMTASDEAAIGIALRTQLQLYPESTFYGTPTARGLVMARYGKLLNSDYRRKLPLAIELASKAADFMGAGNGVWKVDKLFDRAPNSEVKLFTDVNITFTPAQQKNIDWSNGLNYPISFSRNTLFFPALKTVYADDTSILSGFFSAMACVQLEKVGIQVWREFSGSVSLTPAQLIEGVNQSVLDKTTGKFAGLFRVIPEAFISGGDAKLGYSYSLPIKIYGNVSSTVSVLSLQAYRLSSLTA